MGGMGWVSCKKWTPARFMRVDLEFEPPECNVAEIPIQLFFGWL